MDAKQTYLSAMIALATAAFGLIAALAWNAAITELFKLVLKPGAGIVSLFIYAIVVSLIAVWVINSLGRLAERAAKSG
ncbi:hypothetical protein EPN52_14695 [bacterium]|nr:MAG: hypothetical protein EPN52_14695 [bacterium]